MQEKINELLEFLRAKKNEEYTVEETLRYHRIVYEGRSAHCFIVKEDFSNKSVGSVKAGDLMKPKHWAQPAKHPRGNLFDRSSWDKAFQDRSMTYLNNY